MIKFGANARERAKKRRALELKLSASAIRKAARQPEGLALAPARRVMSFLACRIRGFDQIVESLRGDPESLTRLVRSVMTPLTKAVLDRNGAIDRMTPDGFTAFFNAPVDDTEHAVHACECALAMMQALEKANRSMEHAVSADGKPLGQVGIGVGVNTGEAIVGDFGTEAMAHYTVAGPESLLAAAIEQRSAEYGSAILVADSTRALAENSFAFLEVDVVISRTGGPMPLFALLGTTVSRANPKFLALKGFHERIFQAYRARDWETARSLIGECRALPGANPVLCDLYAKRIAHLEAHPPGANWNGIFDLAPM